MIPVDQNADLRMQCLNLAIQAQFGPQSTIELADRYFNWVACGIDITKLPKEALPKDSPHQINS
jgi:hypothetical protein